MKDIKKVAKVDKKNNVKTKKVVVKKATAIKKSNKETRLLAYLKKHKSITSIEAIVELSDTRLSATIFNLKKEGYSIEKIQERSINKYGEKVHYDRYFLEEDREAVYKKYMKMLKLRNAQDKKKCK